jgi:hypothetical protein
MLVRIWPDRLVSITANVVNRVSPSPSATTRRPVCAAGRCRLASASRKTGLRGRGSREAIMRITQPSRVSSSTRPSAEAMNRAANAGSRAVPIASAAISPAADDDRQQEQQAGRRAGSSPPRNSVAAGTVLARASGSSANTKAISRP